MLSLKGAATTQHHLTGAMRGGGPVSQIHCFSRKVENLDLYLKSSKF